MGDGLKRARAAAKASRTGTCPVCLRPVKVSSAFGRILPHGPVGNRCPGSGELPKKG